MKSILTSMLFLGFAFTANAEPQKKDSAKAETYPLETCVISGEALGDHGKPYVFEHEGKEVRLCCKACLKDFNKEPEKHLEKIEKAREEAAKKSAE